MRGKNEGARRRKGTLSQLGDVSVAGYIAVQSSTVQCSTVLYCYNTKRFGRHGPCTIYLALLHLLHLALHHRSTSIHFIKPTKSLPTNTFLAETRGQLSNCPEQYRAATNSTSASTGLDITIHSRRKWV